MAAVQPNPARKPCSERDALMYQINSLIKEMFSLHNEQLEAVLRGDAEAELQLQGRLREVRDRRALVIERLRNHIASHDC